jgi:hypothetical protein
VCPSSSLLDITIHFPSSNNAHNQRHWLTKFVVKAINQFVFCVTSTTQSSTIIRHKKPSGAIKPRRRNWWRKPSSQAVVALSLNWLLLFRSNSFLTSTRVFLTSTYCQFSIWFFRISSGRRQGRCMIVKLQTIVSWEYIIFKITSCPAGNNLVFHCYTGFPSLELGSKHPARFGTYSVVCVCMYVPQSSNPIYGQFVFSQYINIAASDCRLKRTHLMDADR